MKLRLILAASALVVAGLLYFGLRKSPAAATGTAAVASPAPASSTPTADLEALITRIQAKLQAGKHTAAELADDLPGFDALLAKYHDQKTDEVAKILYMKAALYAQVFDDSATAIQLFTRLKQEFPNTRAAAAVEQLLAAAEHEAAAAKAQAALIGRPAPELHFKWSNLAGLKTLSELKGKVVVLDFWATWCGPCVASFPDVRELVEHYKNFDVAVVGVTSLQGSVTGLEVNPIDTKDNPAKELALMTDYIKAKDITWSIAVSDEEVFNPDYGITGIPYMAIVAPDGTVRHTGLHPAAPLAEKVEKIDAILKEFGRPVAASQPKS